MASELEALLETLRQGTQAQAQLPGLTTEMAEAKALRNQPLAPIAQDTGYMSPFAALAGMIDQGRGAQQRRTLAPQIAQAQQRVTNAQSSGKEYTLRNAAAKAAADKAAAAAEITREDLHRTSVLKNARDVANIRKTSGKGTTKSKPEVYVDLDGGKHNISFENGVPYEQNAQGEVVQANISEMTKYEKPTAGNKVGKSVPFKDEDGLITNISYIDGVPSVRINGKWEEKDLTRMTEVSPSQVREDKPQAYKAYMDKDGNIHQIQRVGEDTFEQDANGKRQPISMNGMRDVDDVLEEGSITAEKLGKMKAPEVKLFLGADSAIRQMNRLQDLAAKLNDDDIEKLESGKQSVFKSVLESALPGALSTYIQQNKMGYSPAALEYLRSIQEFSAGIRHDKYGSALTRPEIAFSNMWLAGAPGLTGQQSNDRMRGTVSNMIGAVGGIDNLYKTGLTERLTKLVERKSLTEIGDMQNVDPAITAAMQENDAHLEELIAERNRRNAAKQGQP